jgi:hypothetical protein
MKSSLYHQKYFGTYMFKMGLHGPFGHFKDMLWPKERSWVKLTIWLLTIKSQESTQILWVQVACNILLQTSWWGLQLYFRLHLNQRSTHKVMGLQSCGSSNCGNFRIPTWESRDKMTLGVGPVARHKIYYKGEGGGFAQVRVVVSLVNLCLPMARPCTKMF